MSSPQTATRAVKVADEDWQTFDANTREVGGKSSVLRKLIHLYNTEQATRKRALRQPDPVAERNPSIPRDQRKP